MNIFTIGFTKKSAEEFFTILASAGVRRLLDVRLNNVSQLAGFTKKEDLRYFTKEICGIEYHHLPALAPTKEMLDTYKREKGSWANYEKIFLTLMRERQIDKVAKKSLFSDGCLLCSEETAQHCHRRLVAEYLQLHWSGVRIHHLP